ncbi:hypothetical protein TNCV_1744091 [Trichonephila clavipes]|nr:hypothetical protein TNCV_1744091 [Trichonephila clavipes]
MLVNDMLLRMPADRDNNIGSRSMKLIMASSTPIVIRSFEHHTDDSTNSLGSTPILRENALGVETYGESYESSPCQEKGLRDHPNNENKSPTTRKKQWCWGRNGPGVISVEWFEDGKRLRKLIGGWYGKRFDLEEDDT